LAVNLHRRRANEAKGDWAAKLSEEEKKEWEEKATILSVAGGGADSLMGTQLSTQQGLVPGDSQQGPSTQGDQEPACAAVADATSVPFPPGKKEKRPHHELILLTRRGDVHRIVPSTVTLCPRFSVAASRRIVKFSKDAEVSDSVISASYSVTLDVPETAKETQERRKLVRKAAQEEKENRLEAIKEEDGSEEEEEAEEEE